MNKIYTIFGLVLILMTSCLAQKNTSTSQPEPSQLENALLWQIEGKELTQNSYLYGTIHMIGKEDFFLTDATKDKFKETEQVTFEINMDDMNDLGSQLSLMMDAFMKNNTTLKDLLSDEDYKVVGDHFKEMGLPLFMLEKIKLCFSRFLHQVIWT